MGIIFILIVALAPGCGSNNTSSSGTGSIAATLQWKTEGKAAAKTAALAPDGVNTIRAIVSGPGMDTITQEFPASPGLAGTGSIESVPAGTGRSVTFQGLFKGDGITTLLYTGSVDNVTVTAGMPTYLTVQMSPVTYVISGTIKDGDTPISGLTVALYDSTETPHTAVTDATGRYTFSGLSSGNYLLDVNQEGYSFDQGGGNFGPYYQMDVLIGNGNIAVDISAIGSTRFISTIAGSRGVAGSADGTGSAASFYFPQGITTDGSSLFVADYSNGAIRKVVPATGTVTTIASNLFGHAITSDGTSLYVTVYSMIGRVSPSTGSVSAVAGSFTTGSADGVGDAASFYNPWGITTDGRNLYVSDTSNHTVRQIVIATGAVTTIAGSPGMSGLVNGIGSAARFSNPQGIATDGANLYVADTGNSCIRKIDLATRNVSTFAGTGSGFMTDGTGLAASFASPRGIAMDGSALYVNDFSALRKIVLATGAVTTIIGTPGQAGSSDGFGAYAGFDGTSGPNGITATGGSLYVTDTKNYTIRKIQ